MANYSLCQGCLQEPQLDMEAIKIEFCTRNNFFNPKVIFLLGVF